MKKLYRKGTVHPSPPLISEPLSFLPAAILTLALSLSHEDKQVLAYLISCSSGSFSGDISGNRRTSHKSSASPTSSTSAKSGAAVFSAVDGGGADFSGHFSGNRRNTQKSETPNSAPASSGGGGKGGAAVTGGGADHVPAFNCYCFSCYMSYWIKWDSSPNRQLIHEILDAYEDGLQTKKEKSKRRNKNKSSNIIESCELKKKENGSGSGQSENPVEETSGSRGDGGDDEEGAGCDEQEGTEKGSVRRFVSFLGERIWSVWT